MHSVGFYLPTCVGFLITYLRWFLNYVLAMVSTYLHAYVSTYLHAYVSTYLVPTTLDIEGILQFFKRRKLLLVKGCSNK